MLYGLRDILIANKVIEMKPKCCKKEMNKVSVLHKSTVEHIITFELAGGDNYEDKIEQKITPEVALFQCSKCKTVKVG